jgi:hypothetical protein
VLHIVIHVAGGLTGAATILWTVAWWEERRERSGRVSRKQTDDDARARVAVDLHRIHTNLDTARMRTEIRRDAARNRRLLAEELRDLDRLR